MLATGTKAPDFALPDQNGDIIKLSDYRGEKVILYFYSRDMTAGCTRQTCAFGELYPQFLETGAVILGVSKGTRAHRGAELSRTAHEMDSRLSICKCPVRIRQG